MSGRALRVLYRVLLVLAVPLLGPYYLWRGLRTGRYLSLIRARLSLDPTDPALPNGALWLHAVSVGEVIVARRLARSLRTRFGLPVVLSSTTLAGLAIARAGLAAGEVAGVLVAPLDYRFAVRRAFSRLAPRALILVEAELWPNWLMEAARRRVPVALVNARISPRAAQGYALASALFRPLVAEFAAIGARSEDDRQRLASLGARTAVARVTGDLKFDAPAPELSREAARAHFALPAGPIWVAGSTHPGEHELVLAAFAVVRSELPAATLVLAPRKDWAPVPGWSTVSRRSGATTSAGGVLLLDTLGELALAYRAGDVAFVGGSLVPAGGHNLLEPAAAGLPVLFGPHTENFAEIAEALLRVGAAVRVKPGELAVVVLRLLRSSEERQTRSRAALAAVAAGRGSINRTLDLLETMLR